MERFPTRKPPHERLLIFARVPEPGRVKSRLAQEIGPDRALEAYEAMLRDVLDRMRLPHDDGIETEVLWTASRDIESSLLRRYFAGYPLAMQTGANLGDRMAMAIAERIFFHATEKVVTVGVDDPTLPRESVLNGFALLNCCDWVLGPALDGGYYLIGCRGASYHSSVFQDIEWGSDTVFEETLLRIRALGATVAVLPVRRDIDQKADLVALSKRADAGGGNIGETLRRWGWVE